MPSKYYKYAKPPSDFLDLLKDRQFLKIYKQTEREWIGYWKVRKNYFNNSEVAVSFIECFIGDFVTRLRRNLVNYPNRDKLKFLLNTNNWRAAVGLKENRYLFSEEIVMLDKLQSLIGNNIDKELDIRGEINDIKSSLNKMVDYNNLLVLVDNNLVPLLKQIDEKEKEICRLI